MVKRKNRTNTSSNGLKWVGYCIECEKWRNNIHTLTNVNTGQHRCSICASVMLIICGVCDGEGQLREGGVERYCDGCGGHKVVPQKKVGGKK